MRDFTPSKVFTDYFPLVGGLDEESPSLTVRPGRVIAAQNYEAWVHGGYRRIYGYERFDGRSRPSDASYYVISATVTGAVAVGDTITGATSGATGKVLYVSGSTIVFTRLTGTFQSAEALQVGGFTQAISTSTAEQNAANTPDLHLDWLALAADEYRTSILAPTGSGSILGVVFYKGTLYCFRNNAGGTAAVLWKSTASGWTQVSYYYELSFTAGSGTAPSEGATITKGAVSATLKRLVVESGSFGGSNAAGRMIITAPSGGSFSAGAFTAGITATCSGAETAITMAPNGRFEFDIYNFTGSLDTLRVYGADGVNRHFEFDGDVLVPLVTGVTGQFPKFIRAHKKHLFVSYRSSLQHSSIGNPYQYTLLTGAAELNVGDEITGMLSQLGNEGVSGTLAVFSRNSTTVLNGSSSSNWQLVQSSPETGALPYTQQNIGVAHYLDDRGLMIMRAVQEFGNFEHASVSRMAQRYFDNRRGLAIASVTLPSRNQYRVFFTDGSGAAVTMDGRKVLGIMPLSFPNAVTCAWMSEDTSGRERVFFGSTNGMVYEMERGTSFDGAAVTANFRAAFHHSKSPQVRKKYRNAVFDTRVTIRATLAVQADVTFGDDHSLQPPSESQVLYGGGGYYDVSAYYEQTFYDAAITTSHRYKVTAVGQNIGLLVSTTTAKEFPHIISGVTLIYSPQRLER